MVLICFDCFSIGFSCFIHRPRQWQLAETCGLPLAALAADFATLPEIISRGGAGAVISICTLLKLESFKEFFGILTMFFEFVFLFSLDILFGEGRDVS